MPKLVFRDWWTVVILAAVWLSIFGIAAVFAFDSVTSARLAAAAAVVLAFVGVVAAVRTLRSCLWVDEAAVTIRNTWSTRSWAWDEIGEIGWDAPSWSRGGLQAISVCALGDPYTHTASATASGHQQMRRYSALLDLDLAKHGVSNRMLDDITTRHRWWADPRSSAARRS
jgi:hypothetical protein